jgi:hypothetical protein
MDSIKQLRDLLVNENDKRNSIVGFFFVEVACGFELFFIGKID